MIPKLKFGRTGHMSSRLIFGAYALSQATRYEKPPLDEEMQAMMEKYEIQPVFPGW